MKTYESKLNTVSFTQSFIDSLADYIFDHYISKGQSLDRLAVVFGGRRPSLFLNRALSKRAKKLVNLPNAFSIDEFMAMCVRKQEEFQEANLLEHSYVIYQLAQDNNLDLLKNKTKFSEFLPWSMEILNFIDQLDLECLDSSKLGQVQSNATLGYDVPEDINSILQNIVLLREKYHEYQLEHKSFTRGFQYYRTAKHIANLNFEEFDQVLWCNFFYFHQAEKDVALSLYQQDKASFFFQGDQRKWPILKTLADEFGEEILEGKEPDETEFNLNLYSGFNTHSQVVMAQDIAQKVNDPEKTVVVLPQSESLIPLISSVATNVDEFNVSMGYPLKRSALFALFSLIIQAQRSRKNDRYYARDYLNVLLHPFVSNLPIAKHETAMRLISRVIEDALVGEKESDIAGFIYLSLDDVLQSDRLWELIAQALQASEISIAKDELKEFLENIHNLCFESWEKVGSFKSLSEVIVNLLSFLNQYDFWKKYPLNDKVFEKIEQMADELVSISFSHEQFSFSELFLVLEQYLEKMLIAFRGSPLKGMQILGLFETRSLNFDDVIVLDANEGVLPHMNVYRPLIPREVMIQLGLDSLEIEEEVQRYHFMRLISSAKNVHLIYQEGRDKMRSRFVEELIWEKELKEQKLSAIPIKYGRFQGEVVHKPEVINKTPEVVEFLKNFTYSASSINIYLRNPVDFYYNYVLGLREKEDLLDDPENLQIGTFLHDYLEGIYKPFVGQKPVIDKAFIQKAMQKLEDQFAQRFAQPGKSDAFLMKSVVVNRIKRFWEKEAEYCQDKLDKILYIENLFKDTLELASGEYQFVYKVDRIDQQVGGNIVIYDYKTGAQDIFPQKFEQLQSLDLNRETILNHIKSFQMPLYIQYLLKHYDSGLVNACFYNLRTLDKKYFLKSSDLRNVKDMVNFYLTTLDVVMAEIVDPEVPFS